MSINKLEPMIPTQLLDYPLGFQAMVAFCTDIDDSDFATFDKVHRCFYGLEEGYEGVELELSNSYWLLNSERPKSNSIFLFDGDFRRHKFSHKLSDYFKSDLFDTIHSYGQFGPLPFTRDIAKRCLEEMSKESLDPKLWTYHGDRLQSQNLRPGDNDWIGDLPDSGAYHLDLLSETAVRYIRIPPSLDLFENVPPLRKTRFRDDREFLTVVGSSILKAPNDFDDIESRVNELDSSGMLPYERRRLFQPSERYPNKVQTWKPEMLPHQLSHSVLNSIVDEGRSVIFNQHLTQSFCSAAYEMTDVISALRRLSNYQSNGKILVTTPVRLINYHRVKTGINYEAIRRRWFTPLKIRIEDKTNVDGIEHPLSKEDLVGIEIAFDTKELGWMNPKVFLGGQIVDGFEVITDYPSAGRATIRFPWNSIVDQQRALIQDWRKDFLT